jgi:impB/mucB/samB family C-terminal domain
MPLAERQWRRMAIFSPEPPSDQPSSRKCRPVPGNQHRSITRGEKGGLAFPTEHFGKAGAHFHAFARGEDHRPVLPDRPRKSAGSETTYPKDLETTGEIETAIGALADEVWAWCERTRSFGRKVTVKLRYADFRMLTRSRSSTSRSPTGRPSPRQRSRWCAASSRWRSRCGCWGSLFPGSMVGGPPMASRRSTWRSFRAGRARRLTQAAHPWPASWRSGPGGTIQQPRRGRVRPRRPTARCRHAAPGQRPCDCGVAECVGRYG